MLNEPAPSQPPAFRGISGWPATSARPAAAALRRVHASLQFAVGGGRTVLTRQNVRYPLHVTRPFYLDASWPELTTLYLQSASGGIYAGDRLSLAIEAMPGAAVHVTTPASTIVHDSRGQAAEQTTTIVVGSAAFAALTPEPLVLFPGASVSNAMHITLQPSARAIVSDGFFSHDPGDTGRLFCRYRSATVVDDPQGRSLGVDYAAIDGTAFAGPASPLGRYRACASMWLLGPDAERLSAEAVEQRLDALGCLAAISPLPNAIGVGMRILAVDGGALARGLEAGFELAFSCFAGAAPARRRK